MFILLLVWELVWFPQSTPTSVRETFWSLDWNVRNFEQCQRICKYKRSCQTFTFNPPTNCKMNISQGPPEPEGDKSIISDRNKNNRCFGQPCLYTEICVPVEGTASILCLPEDSLQSGDQRQQTSDIQPTTSVSVTSVGACSTESLLSEDPDVQSQTQTTKTTSDVVSLAPAASSVSDMTSILSVTTAAATTTSTLTTTSVTTTSTTLESRTVGPCESVKDCLSEKNQCLDAECRCEAGYSYNPRDDICVETCQEYSDDFSLLSYGYCSSGHNDAAFAVSTFEDCSAKCIEETSFVCRTFEIWGGGCYLSVDTKLDVSPSNWELWSGCRYYQRNCL